MNTDWELLKISKDWFAVFTDLLRQSLKEYIDLIYLKKKSAIIQSKTQTGLIIGPHWSLQIASDPVRSAEITDQNAKNCFKFQPQILAFEKQSSIMKWALNRISFLVLLLQFICCDGQSPLQLKVSIKTMGYIQSTFKLLLDPENEKLWWHQDHNISYFPVNYGMSWSLHPTNLAILSYLPWF